MKRVLTVVLVALLAVALVSCRQVPAASESPQSSAEASVQPSASAPPEESAGMANPWKTVADAQAVADMIGITMSPLPEGATDISYSVAEISKTAQAVFTWNGGTYTFRMAPDDAVDDLSGMYVDFKTEESRTFADVEYEIEYNEGKEGVSEWEDKTNKIDYSVTMSEGATGDKLIKVTEALIPVG